MKKKRKEKIKDELNKWDLLVGILSTVRGAFQSLMPGANRPGAINFTTHYMRQRMEVSHSLGPLGLVECSG